MKANNEQVYDEVRNYQDYRYIGASEAVYRILEYDIIETKPAVERLEVHLPDRQQIYFHEGQEVEAATRPNKKTKLTMWFAANKNFQAQYKSSMTSFHLSSSGSGQKKVNARQSMRFKKIPRDSYAQEVEHFKNYDFTFSTKENFGRMYNLSPKECERYTIFDSCSHIFLEQRLLKTY